MSVSIVTCPQCKSLLLSDTVQCPSCHHVLNPSRAVDLSEFKTHSEVIGAAGDDLPCPDCGEMVRKELVRCWRCGGFLRPEIAESYERMRQNSQTPSAPALKEISPASRSVPSQGTSLPPLADDDDDFSLGPGVTAIAPGQMAATAATDEAYELATSAAAPKSESAEAVPPLKESAQSPEATSAAGDSEAHSVSTAGDVLLDIARQEEQESESRRKTRGKRRGGPASARGGFVIFCPYGHQIEVQERHRGQVGKCPRCKAQFIVPQVVLEEKPSEPETSPAASATAPVEQPGALSAGKFTRWMADIHIHSLDPTKLKLKPGSLEASFTAMDIAFGLDGVLLVTLGGKKGMFGKGKKPEEIRAEVVAHLAASKPLPELPAAAHRLFGPDTIKQIQVVQPVVYAHESMFAGIPVFGNHRIAVRLPKPADSNELLFASFCLSEFREFAKQMAEVFGVEGLGEEEGIPLTDKTSEFKCHYTDAIFQALDNTDYHKADPQIKLSIVGRKCEGCGLIVSEDGRKKEKLGGADGKGIAKAKCPKCQKKFGNITLYAVEAPPAAEAAVAASDPA